MLKQAEVLSADGRHEPMVENNLRFLRMEPALILREGHQDSVVSWVLAGGVG